MKELQDLVAAFETVKSSGLPAALATLVKVKGSTYRRSGARMLMTSDGRMVGSLSGGCLEGDVFEQAQPVMSSGQSILVSYDTTSDEDIVWGLGLGCKGIVHVLIERLATDSELSPMAFLSECLHRRQMGVLATVFRIEGQVRAKVGEHLMLHSDGRVTSDLTDSELIAVLLSDAQAAQRLGKPRQMAYPRPAGEVEAFIEVIEPPRPLIIFGAGHDAVPVVGFAKELGWHVTVVDSRPAYATKERFPRADAVILSPFEKVGEQVRLDERTAAVVMTHNYLHDFELLKRLLPSPVPYLGVLGPKRRTEQLLGELLEQGMQMNEAQLSRLYAPVGLDLGADSPEEIALAIVAEIQAVGARREGGLLRNRNGPIHDDSDG